MHADNHVGTNRLITQETIAIPEILDLIIDNLHDDTKSLRSCSLVSKSWLPSSRYHLFETKTIYVEFYFPEIPSRVGLESFLTFILSSSAIAETVRTLILVGGRGSSWESATLPECDLCDIIAVANKLPFLRHLKLQKLDLTCGHLASMSPYDSFIRLPIAKLSLYGVSIDQSINIIDNFLQHLPALLDADFTGIRLVRLADGLAALLASEGERLRHLEIDVTYSGDTGNSRPSWELAENIVVSLPMKSLSLHSIRFLETGKIIDRLPILAERGVIRVELIKQTIWD
ncbi:hypothetical protein C8Q75DRAFT_736241 [Abortiporus biennis]|nr:hypothetical protein C8Q75DRAFT_736241 [Abortiporus biennis]